MIKKEFDFQNKTTYGYALPVSQIGYFVVSGFENLRRAAVEKNASFTQKKKILYTLTRFSKTNTFGNIKDQRWEWFLE